MLIFAMSQRISIDHATMPRNLIQKTINVI
jgi:hypothetical protein